MIKMGECKTNKHNLCKSPENLQTRKTTNK